MGKDALEASYDKTTEVTKLNPDAVQTGGSATGELSIRAKYLTTAVIYFCNITFGISAAYLAPIVIDFKNAYETDMTQISVIFTVSRVVMLVASMAFGFIFNHVNRHALVVFLLFTTGVMMVSLPFGPTLVVFGVIQVLTSITLSGYAMAQIVWVIEVWKDAAGPYIQGQHFSFALGCIFPSLIFAPFLNDGSRSPAEVATYGSNFTYIDSNTTHINNAGETASNPIDPASILSRLYIPCGICGGLVILGSIFQLMLFLLVKVPKGGKPVQNRKEAGGAESKGLGRSGQKLKKGILITLAASFVGMFQSMESITFQYLPTFAHYSKVQMTEVEGANIMSAFTIAYTLARLAGIFISFKVKPQILLCVNILFVVASNVVLLIAGNGDDTQSTMLVGAVLLGIGFSTSIPSVFDYLKIHLDITNVVGAILMVAGGAIAAVFPIIVGVFIETTPAVIVYLSFACIVVGGATFVGIMVLMRGNTQKL